MSNNVNNEQYTLMRKLVSSLVGERKELVEPMFKKALESFRTYRDDFQTSFSPFEEQLVVDDIHKFFRTSYTNSDDVIRKFDDIYKTLQTDLDSTVLAETLSCLLKLGECNQATLKSKNCQVQPNEINGNVTLSTEFSSGDTLMNSLSLASIHQSYEIQESPSKERIESPHFKKNSGPTHHLYTDTPPMPGPKATSSLQGSLHRANITPNVPDSNKSNNSPMFYSNSLDQRVKNIPKRTIISSSETESNESPRPNHLPVHSLSESTKHSKRGDICVTEYEIMKELVFCMQGIEGNIIKFVSLEDGFTLDPHVIVDQEYMVRHMMELGYLHNFIRYYEKSLADTGIVAQGLLIAIQREMTDYYRSLAELNKQLSCPSEVADTPLSEEEHARLNLPTLIQMDIWSRRPLEKLQTLCDVLHKVQDKRGGQIVSLLAFRSCHGNPRIREIYLRLLSSAMQPLYKHIIYWVVYGEIIDTHEEFFIKAEISADKGSWDRSFVLRPSMKPEYMSITEATQILETGRNMNFLHNTCLQRPPLTASQESLLQLEKQAWDDVKSLIRPYNKISELIDNAYREVSKVVLQTLCQEFKMSAHLEALRKYMLLGQGDFIQHLLEIIEPDLNKPVGTLHAYSMMRSLEDAIYKSNSQFDDPEVLKKLGMKKLLTSNNESFSEAFCLQYKLDGPLNEIFKSSLVAYDRMFSFMWRVKRAHHMTLKMWRGLKLLHKQAQKMLPETKLVFHQVNGLIGEMLNFLNHFQYYIGSEVVEVSWRKFKEEMAKMESLEKVLEAHNAFLTTVQSKCMCNDQIAPSETQITMAWHVRSLLDYAQELVPLVETFQTTCEAEEARRKRASDAIAEPDRTFVLEQENELASIVFSDDMNKMKTGFRLLSNQYVERLKSLLTLFSQNHDDNDLISLRNRIDCNKYHNLQD